MNPLSLRSLTVLLILAAALAMSMAGTGGPGSLAPSPALSPPLVQAESFAEAVPEEVLAKLQPGVSSARRQEIFAALGLTELEHVPELRLSHLRLPQGLPLDQALRGLGDLPEVEYAEPNYLFRTAVFPNDPLYSRQIWYYGLIEMPQAWNVERGDPSLLVAVLDSGVDLSHPDLRGRIWKNPGEIPRNGLDDDDNGCVDDVNGCTFLSAAAVDPSCDVPFDTPSPRVDDDQGHGTFVAGIIAAETGNSIGVAGVAPGVTVMPVKVLDCTGAGSAMGVARGLLYAAQAGARVANLSFGGADASSTLRDIIRRVHDEFGVVLVAPVGNDGAEGVSFPARLPEVIAVAASARGEPSARAAFSNWGPEVSVAAPGEDILGPLPEAACGQLATCIRGQPYGTADGTSFAAPQVAGLAALILSRSPQLGPEQVLSAIQRAALDLPDGDTPHWDGAGRIRAATSLRGLFFTIGVAGVSKS